VLPGTTGPDREPIDPKGPHAYNLQKVEPGDYETLTYLLAHAENNDVVIVRNKDRGLDARLPDPVGRTTLRGWQAKRFAAGRSASDRSMMRSRSGARCA
jgi:hypothetical protein